MVCTLLDLRISIGNGEGIARRRSRSVVVSTQGFESCGGGLDLPKTSIKFATLGQYLSKTEVGNKRLVKFCSSFFYGRHDTAK